MATYIIDAQQYNGTMDAALGRDARRVSSVSEALRKLRPYLGPGGARRSGTAAKWRSTGRLSRAMRTRPARRRPSS